MKNIQKLYESLDESEKSELRKIILSENAKKAGSTVYESKAEISRQNGKLGGRPKRVSIQVEPKILKFKELEIPYCESFLHAAKAMEALGYSIDPKKGFSGDTKFRDFFPPISRRYYTYKDPDKARHSNAVVFIDFEYIEKFILRKLANPLSKPPEKFIGKREKYMNQCYAFIKEATSKIKI